MTYETSSVFNFALGYEEARGEVLIALAFTTSDSIEHGAGSTFRHWPWLTPAVTAPAGGIP
jgi:hypothetical protein